MHPASPQTEHLPPRLLAEHRICILLHGNTLQRNIFSIEHVSVDSTITRLGIVGIAEIVIGKLRKDVRRNNAKCKRRGIEEKSTTEDGKLGPNQRCPAPDPNQGKFVHHVLEGQDKKTQEKAGREQRGIEEYHEQDLCKVGVSLAEIVKGSLKTQVHLFLCLGARSKNVLLQVGEPVGESKQRSEPHIKQENRECSRKQISAFETKCRRDWSNNLKGGRDHQSGMRDNTKHRGKQHWQFRT